MLPRWLITFRAFALASAFAAAFVQIATYITDDKRDWLWIHIGVNIAAYIAVALTTIYTTVNLTQQDQNKFSVPAYWANNVVMRTWWLGVSKTWRWHVAAAVGRLGLALALAQHLNVFPLMPQDISTFNFQGIISPFYYFSHMKYLSPMTLTIRSQWETAIIGIVVLSVFALFEVSLSAALSCLINAIFGTSPHKIFTTALLRLGIILSVFVIMACAHQFVRQSELTKLNTRYDIEYSFRDLHRAAFTWLDGGTMMAADFARPLGNVISPTGGGVHYGGRSKRVENTNEPPDYGYILEYDNKPMILHTVIQALMAYATYILAIIASLQLAQYLHWRREQSESPTPAPTTP